MAGVNKVILVGNLGNDPDMRYMPSGEPIANISVATSITWSDRNTGERREKTEWHRVVAFSRTAEIIGQYCKKGSKIYVEGRLQTRKWTDKDGQDRYTTEIVAEQIQMLDSRNQDSGYDDSYGNNRAGNYGNNNRANQYQGTQGDYHEAKPAAPRAPVAPKEPQGQQFAGPEIDQNGGFDDDEIPF